MGSAGVEFMRLVPNAYTDGVSAPARMGQQSARFISNRISAQSGDIKNLRQASDYLWLWGQFLDHDITETPIASPAEELDVLVPAGDAWFDPDGTGGVVIGLDRSAYHMVDGKREQLNEITAFIDASNVYGSDVDRAMELRANDGTGRLKVSDGDLLMFNVNGFSNAPTAFDPSFFLAGDIRANEQVSLTAMHTLWVREHNHHADRIAGEEPGLSGEEIYQRARAIVGAEMQRITYQEFLPALLGHGAIPPYQGYDEGVNPGIGNVFATAAYRVGHTMLSPTLLRMNADGSEASEGHIGLLDAFFDPSEIVDNGIDSILRGMGYQVAQDIDAKVIDDVRNFLFGAPGAGGFDLVSLNIQRGRDHGLGSYNDVRESFGLDRVLVWSELNPNPDVISAFEDSYATPDDVDPWVGMVSEPKLAGALVGETLHRVLRDQFIRLRDGDRYWYERALPPEVVERVNQTTLSDVIRRNTSIGSELQADVFRVHPTVAADYTGDGLLNFFDVTEWIGLFTAGDARADFNLDDRLNVFDLMEVLGVIGQGV
jgi:peroxidase